MIDRNLSNLKPRRLNLGREDEIRRAGDDMDIVPRRDQVTDDLNDSGGVAEAVSSDVVSED